MKILAINSGSSSVKFEVYDWTEGTTLGSGQIERIGHEKARLIFHANTRRMEESIECHDTKEAFDIIVDVICRSSMSIIKSLDEIDAVGHRVIHGGTQFVKSTFADEDSLDQLRSIMHLAPLHLPANIAGIEAARKKMPGIPHVMVMDTAWHQTLEPKAYMYALPQLWHDNYAVRRYGFHGTSYLYCTKRVAALLNKDSSDVNLIICHIGSGSSVCAVKNGMSYDTSMGMTPQEGLMMGTRCGDIDPSIIAYINRTTGMDPYQIDSILNTSSGLHGICGYSDRRDILHAAEKGNSNAQLAMEMGSYRIKKYIGSYMAALGRVDAIVFTAAAGEMSFKLRENVLQGLENFGIVIDPEKNEHCTSRNAEFEISTDESPTKVFVIPTNEEMVIIEDTWALTQGIDPDHHRYSFEDRRYVNKCRSRAFMREIKDNPELAKLAICF